MTGRLGDLVEAVWDLLVAALVLVYSWLAYRLRPALPLLITGAASLLAMFGTGWVVGLPAYVLVPGAVSLVVGLSIGWYLRGAPDRARRRAAR